MGGSGHCAMLVNVGTDALAANLKNPFGERLVILDQPVTNLEDVP
jgi:hypothetical protein